MKPTEKRSLRRAVIFCFFVSVLFVFLLITSVTISTNFEEFRHWTPARITCDRSHDIYELCSINGPNLLDPTMSTFFTMGPGNSHPPFVTVKTHPYPRKKDARALGKVRELTLTSSPAKSPCGITHDSPALMFSAGGYTGNFFHEFNDGFLPLFITVNSLFPNDRHRNFILVITDGKVWWIRKYADLLSHFTRHPIIHVDKEITTHCFPSTTVGLVSHGPMTVNSALLPNPKTLMDFPVFLKNAYSKNITTNRLVHKPNSKPRLVLVNRERRVGRTILNIEEVKQTASDIGFDVIIFQPTRNNSLNESLHLIQSGHVLLGVHGAALTHFLFLRPGSVFLQIVPVGTEWLSKTYFGAPAGNLGLEYIEYKIRDNESSLAEVYGFSDTVLRKPRDFVKGDWSKMRLYLKEQNIRVDMVRFRKYLRKAYKKVTKNKKFMAQ